MKKSERIYISICLIILFIGLVGLFSGCKSKTLYVPVESVKTEYINKYQRDSIYIKDSVMYKILGDTIYIEKYMYRYRDKAIHDTIIKTDSIQVPYPVKGDTVEVNKLNWYQEACIWFTSLILVALALYLGIKYRGKILAFFRKLGFRR